VFTIRTSAAMSLGTVEVRVKPGIELEGAVIVLAEGMVEV